MMETDTHLQEIHAQFKANKLHAVEKPQRGGIFLLVDNLARRLIRGQKQLDLQRRAKDEQLRLQISEIIRDQPGCYPLADIAFCSQPPFGHTGFSYTFDRLIGEDSFTAAFWSYNHWGILVQGHPSDYPPEIEIVERIVEPDNDLIEEYPELSSYTAIDRVLHLPKGFRIPVGPLHFKSDSLPISEEEYEANRQRAINVAKAVGVKVDNEILGMVDKMMTPRRKYPNRYFYWQPLLPGAPTRIAIDFDSIDPKYMGINLEDAPVFNATVVVLKEKG